MYTIIPTGMDLTRVYFSHYLPCTAPEGGSHLNSHAVVLKTPSSPLLDLSGAPTATAASRPFFSERRPAAVTDAHTRKLIGVVPGRHMGLFRNTVPIRNVNCVTVLLHETI
ncbi:hypothetical protein Zmor_017919 [Zophobas morio]|uniref:Uncharacterized protein n=1 Tax=Zophobas morio TaxID=2755281 RepID=A0AA38I963_9CUCU|nr:hypothetical protein Zmor_017919 [Zophobas morio]